jgi:hypothetical protein
VWSRRAFLSRLDESELCICQRIKATLRRPARIVVTNVLKTEEKKVESFRVKANFDKRKVESSTLSAKCNILRKDLIENALQLGDLKQALAKSEDVRGYASIGKPSRAGRKGLGSFLVGGVGPYGEFHEGAIPSTNARANPAQRGPLLRTSALINLYYYVRMSLSLQYANWYESMCTKQIYDMQLYIYSCYAHR